MKRMGSKKGMTLVEVIIAIALLGIIAVGMIPAFAAQFKMTVDMKDITIESFDAQGNVENAILELKNALIPVTPDITGIDGASTTTYSIFGRNVTMYKLYRLFPSNNNKDIIVFLSQKLAQMEKRQLLIATGVRIDVSNDSADKIADMKKTPLPTLIGVYDVNTDPNWYVNVYKWYVSKEGNPDPKFPDDYEMLLIPGITPSTLADLSDVVNRFVVFTVTPVDIHGVRGNELGSSNRVYVLGQEWRSGVFAWVDKNEDVSYADGTDVEIPKTMLINAAFDSHIPFLNPELPSETLEPKDGSLYVPMSIDKALGDRVGPLIATGTGKLEWTVDKSIHLATDLTASNNTDINLKTRDGDITLYQYIEIAADGNAVFDGEGFPNLIAYGPTLRSLLGDISLSTVGQGSIMLQSYSTLEGMDATLSAHGPLQTYASTILAGGNILIDSSTGIGYPGNRDMYLEDTALTLKDDYTSGRTIDLKSRNAIAMSNVTFTGNGLASSKASISSNDGITMYETIFNDMNVYLYDDAIMTGGSWNSGHTLYVDDGDTLMLRKSADKVHNAGSLDLGDTGGVEFNTSMTADLANPLEISLGGSGNQVTITTNYNRNVGYADDKTDDSFSMADAYKNLGSGQYNLEYKVSRTAGNIPNLSSLTYDFDSDTGTISIDAHATGPVAANVKLTVSDKFGDGNIFGTVNFTVIAAGEGSATVTVNGVLMHTVTFQDFDGTVLKTESVAHETSATPPASPIRIGFVFIGWDTDYSSVTGNLTVTALYSNAQHAVTFNYYYGRTAVQTVTPVYHGATVIPPANPVRIGYIFNGWDVPLSNVTGDLIANAQYTKDNSLTLYLDATAVTGLSNGDRLSAWSDLSGLGNGLSQTDLKRPGYVTGVINGKPAIRFSGANGNTSVNDYLVGKPWSNYATNTAYTAFVVGKATTVETSNSNGDSNEGFFGDQDGYISMYLRSNGRVGAYNYDNNSDQAVQNYTIGTWKVFTSKLSDGFIRIRQNGGTETTRATGATGSMIHAFELGRVYSNNSLCLDGDIAEVIIYNRALTDPERAAIEDYLGDKYGLF